jgi:hypothetical protein
VTRRSLPVPLALLALTGCGAADLKTAEPKATPCPGGVRQLKVKDVLPEPPLGFSVVPPDPSQVGPVRAQLRQRLGEHLRSAPARLVIKPRDITATTLVYVTNIDERYDTRDLLLGADEMAEQVNAEPQELTIAGDDGVIAAGPSVVVAGGAVGECAGITLVGDTEADVRAIAAKIRRAQ